jgi:hypothetical protein
MTEHINKGRFQKGIIPWNKGKKVPQISGNNSSSKRLDVREKISQAKKGIKLSQAHRDALKKASIGKGRGRKLSEEHRNNISIGKKGMIVSEEHRNNIRNTMIKNKIGFQKGHACWNTGKLLPHVPLIERLRNCSKYRQWKCDVFERDNYCCQDNNEHINKLQAHHIKPFIDIIKQYNIKTYQEGLDCEELWNINNGITICFICHKKYTKERYK